MHKDCHSEHAEKEAEIIIAECEGPLLRYAMRILDDSILAQDAVESVFIEVLSHNRRQPGFSRDDLKTELYRAVHKAVGVPVRGRKRRSMEKRASFSATADAAESAMAAVRMLEPEEQQVVILKFFERLTNREISRITQKREEKVATLLYKSVIKVATEFKRAGLL